MQCFITAFITTKGDFLMKRKTLITIVFIALLATVSTAFLVKQRVININPSALTENTDTQGLKDSDVVAVVSDKELTYGDLEDRVNLIVNANSYDTSMIDMGQFRKQVLDSYVSEVMVGILAEQNGISITDEDFNSAKDDLIVLYGGESAFADYLKSINTTEEIFEETFRVELLTEELRHSIAGDVTPTDDELKTFFEDNRDYYDIVDTVDLYQIIPENEEKAKECKAKFDSGVSFIDCFKEYNTSDSENGHVGVLAKTDIMESVSEIIWSTEVNKLSEPVELQTADGATEWHLFSPASFTEAREVTYEEVAEYVKQDYQSDYENTKFAEYLGEQKTVLGVEYMVDESDLGGK